MIQDPPSHPAIHDYNHKLWGSGTAHCALTPCAAPRGQCYPAAAGGNGSTRKHVVSTSMGIVSEWMPVLAETPNASSGYPKNGLVAHRRGACVFMHACPVSKAKHGLRVRQRSYPVADDASARPGCVLCGVCAAGAPPPFAQLRGTFVSILSHLLSGFMKRSSITRGPDPGLSCLGA